MVPEIPIARGNIDDVKKLWSCVAICASIYIYIYTCVCKASRMGARRAPSRELHVQLLQVKINMLNAVAAAGGICTMLAGVQAATQLQNVVLQTS